VSFIKNKFFKLTNITSPGSPYTSTTYAEIEGSKTDVEKLDTTSDLYYFYSFSSIAVSGYNVFLHVKLQKSNDNFSSNIVDVDNCSYNFSSDTGGGTDYLYKINNVFFIVQNTGNDSLRLVVRTYSSNTISRLHITPHFDGSSGHTKYYYPTLTVKEL
jgi:hypothetical protein